MPVSIEVDILDGPGGFAKPTSRLTRLRQSVRGGKVEQARQFHAIIEAADRIAKTDPSALHGLIRLLGRSVQAHSLMNWSRVERHDCDPDATLFSSRFPITGDGKCFDDLKDKLAIHERISLTTDIILPWPWEPQRLTKSLVNLSPGGRWGKWKQDHLNHHIELWLPWRIAWVHGGNHSITAGVVYGTGKLKPELVYDISDVYKHVRCDGLTFRRVHDNKVVAPVSDLEMAAIFEIGRLLVGQRNS